MDVNALCAVKCVLILNFMVNMKYSMKILTIVLFIVPVFFIVKIEGYKNNGLTDKRFYDSTWYQLTRLSSSVNNQPDCERPDFYICEDLPNTVPPEATKLCDYRNVQYHEQVYRWVAGRGCLFFTPNFLYVGGANPVNLNNGCFYGHLFAPCLEVATEDGTCACYPFDPGFEVVVRTIRNALVDHAQTRWERCFNAAQECCSHVMMKNGSIPDPRYCRATFDAWTCWDRASSGTVAEEICPEFAYSNSGPTCHHFSSKECFENGTWNANTDYSTCSITSRFLSRYQFHIIILSVSIASCLPAVFIFFFYKRLRVDRIILHRNLLIAIIVRNIFVIVSRSTIFIDEITNEGDTIMSMNSVWCRTISVFERLAGNVVFVCMLVEGVYLHRTIVAVFRRKFNINLLYGIGAIIAILPVIVWSIVMALINDHNCWVYYNVDHIQWTLDAPRLCILIVNTGLFVDILRVLLTKIRNSENVNQLSTTKATLFLMPVFGTQFLLTAFRPNTTNCTAEEAYFYITYTLEAFQGIVVAIFYCYASKEVHNLIKITYKKTENAVRSKVQGGNYRRATGISLGFSDRRFTLSTAVPDSKDFADVDEKEEFNNDKPKIHMAEIQSIEANEKYADVIDPVYEIVNSEIKNEDLEPNIDSNRVAGYSKTSSIVDAKDWIKCVSEPTSSVYENSLNDYEVNYLERKFSIRNENCDSDSSKHTVEDIGNVSSDNGIMDENKAYTIKDDNIYEKPEEIYANVDKIQHKNNNDTVSTQNTDSESENELIDEIMQYFDSHNVILESSMLSPNRKEDDKIVFIE